MTAEWWTCGSRGAEDGAAAKVPRVFGPEDRARVVDEHRKVQRANTRARYDTRLKRLKVSVDRGGRGGYAAQGWEEAEGGGGMVL